MYVQRCKILLQTLILLAYHIHSNSRDDKTASGSTLSSEKYLPRQRDEDRRSTAEGPNSDPASSTAAALDVDEQP